tara:strand:- start:1751 stop:3790 length:2040 start_codon:yes stop_codon:yes gene_type:complete
MSIQILLKEKIKKIFLNNPKQAYNYKKISFILNDYSFSKKNIIKSLIKLKKENFLEEKRKGNYILLDSVFVKKGFVSILSKKIYVLDKKEKKFLTEKNNNLKVLNGDYVEFIKKNNVFFIKKIIKRKKDSFIGSFIKRKKNIVFIADNKDLRFNVFLNKKITDFENKKYLVKIINWGNRNIKTKCKIIKEIGLINDRSVEFFSLIKENEINTVFKEETLKEVKKIESFNFKKEIKNRIDFRKTKTFTIDPESAKDHDDAISVKELKNNLWEIGIHIADVSFFVKKNSFLDLEAYERAFSLYLVDRVIPMLPEKISNEICSLKEKKDSFCFSFIITIDNSFNIIKKELKETVINCDKKFSYKEAFNIIKNKKGDFFKELSLLNSFTKELKNKRIKNNSISIEKNEFVFSLNKKNEPINIIKKERNDSHFIVEELMLLTNNLLCVFLKEKTKKIIYRIHDYPTKEKIESLILNLLNHNIKENLNRNNIREKINLIVKNNNSDIIKEIILKSMSKALYSTSNIGHFGLNFNNYLHFTSPIRRYSDLINHRLLKEILGLEKYNYKKNTLEKISNNISKIEILFKKYEREDFKNFQLKFLKNKINTIHEGFITGFNDYKIFITIKDVFEGYEKIKNINNTYFYNKEKNTISNYKNENIFFLGQKIKIIIKEVNFINKHIIYNII